MQLRGKVEKIEKKKNKKLPVDFKEDKQQYKKENLFAEEHFPWKMTWEFSQRENDPTGKYSTVLSAWQNLSES